MSSTMKACLDVLRRTDPRDAAKHLDGLAEMVGDDDIRDELYQRVDVPFEIGVDKDRKFLLCEYNRDGDSHRSPWSNAYFPPLSDGLRPSERLRAVELQANEALDMYRELYYGKATSVGSVYLWDKDGEESGDPSTLGFEGCFLLKNKVDEGNDWNSIHVVDAAPTQKKGVFRYQLTSTLIISITPSPDEMPSTNLSGSLVRRNVREGAVDEDGDHVVNVGGLLEDVEAEMRSAMDALYIQKTRTVVEMVRKERPGARTEGQEHTRVLNEAVLAMAMGRKANVSDD